MKGKEQRDKDLAHAFTEEEIRRSREKVEEEERRILKMIEQEKIGQDIIKDNLGIPEDTLSLYEDELGLDPDLNKNNLEDYAKDNLEAVEIFHKLRQSGLTPNEINLITSFSELLGNVNLDSIGGVKNFYKISPNYRLRQTLKLAKQEISNLRNKTKELEELLTEALEAKKQILILEDELDAKQKIIDNKPRWSPPEVIKSDYLKV